MSKQIRFALNTYIGSLFALYAMFWIAIKGFYHFRNLGADAAMSGFMSFLLFLMPAILAVVAFDRYGKEKEKYNER